MSEWGERQFLGLTAAIVGGSLAVMAGLVLWVYSRYGSLLDEIGEMKKENEKKEAEAAALKDRQRQYDDALRKHSRALEMVPESSGMSELGNQVTEKLRNSGLELSRITEIEVRAGARRGEAAKKSPGETHRMLVECRGGFDEFGRFLTELEMNMPRLVSVVDLAAEAHKKGVFPDAKATAYKLTFEVYSCKPASEASGSRGGGR